MATVDQQHLIISGAKLGRKAVEMVRNRIFYSLIKFQGSIVQEPRKLEDYLTERPQPKGIDVLCSLKHFAIITYAVPAARFEGFINRILK
ncbi:hypothetical protein BV504_16965 [Halomonas sp. 'Soap Lake |nr:hypothetical protein B2G49_17115 [Halomonas sp. 'Soap Lake \